MNEIKVLNLYAGIGGNRKLWQGVDVTAVEFNPTVADVYSHHFPDDAMIVGDAHDYLLHNYMNFDFIWSSPPCQTHSHFVHNMTVKAHDRQYPYKYADMRLYQEIILLQSVFEGIWVVENTKPYYKPLIAPSFTVGRHYYWSDRMLWNIPSFPDPPKKFDAGSLKPFEDWIGISCEGFELDNISTRTAYRNCVNPYEANYILNELTGAR